MSSVDDRIVNMQFNSSQFTQGASDSLKALQTVETAMGKAATSGGMGDMATGVDQVTGRFSAMKVAGVAAIATIASKATIAGGNLLKSLTIAPVMAGFQEYELNLKSVQTIMANTGENIKTTNKYLDELNRYSDKTIYNFSQMANNIGKFTAAGVELPAATAAIKGMANTAALTGADANQLNSAMYQMSQALASGTIKLMDWNSLVNANMGTENMQESLKATAMTLGDEGKAMDAAIAKHGTFRDSLTEGWLSADIFTKTMKVMAGTVDKAGEPIAYTVEQLKQMGYSTEAAKELNRLSGAAIDSATKIKTFTQLIDVVKETVASGWAQVFENLFGNLNQAKELWTTVGKTITDAIGGVFDAVNGMLVAWQKAGGYQAMWAGFGNIFQAIGNILAPFVAAFQELLPSTGNAGKGLANLSKGFESVTGWIEIATRGFSVLTPVLVGIAKVISFVFGQIFSLGGKAISAISGLINMGKEIAGGILGGIIAGFTGSELYQAVAEIANNIVKWIKDLLGIHSPATELIPVGEGIILGIAKGIMDSVPRALEAMKNFGSKMLGMGGDLISNIVDGVVSGANAAKGLLPIGREIVMNIADGVASAAGVVVNAVRGVLSDVLPKLGGMASSAASATGEGFATAGSHVATVWNFIGDVMSVAIDLIGAGFSKLGDSMGWLAEKFGELTKGLNAQEWASLLNTLFAGSAILLIRNLAKDLGDWKKSFEGIGDVFKDTFGQMTDTLKTMQGAIKAEMIRNIAIGVALLAASVLVLSLIDPKKLAISLGAIAVMLGTLVGTLALLSKVQGDFSMAVLAASIAMISGAMLTLAIAVSILGQQDPLAIAQGLGALAIMMGILVGAIMVLDKVKFSLLGIATSMLIMAVAMNAMAIAVLAFGSMDMAVLAQGLTGLAIGLGILVGAMLILSNFSGQVAVVAGSIYVMAAAMTMLSLAVRSFGSMDMAVMAQGLAGVAIGIGIMVGALLILSNFSGQAAVAAGAIMILAVSMNILVGVIVILGTVPWQTIAVGIGFMALALGVLLAAGAVAMVIAPGLLALGIAVGMLGAAMMMAGVGMSLFGAGFAVLVATGTAGIAFITAAIQAFMALLPTIAHQVAAAFIAFLKVIANAAPKIRKLMGEIIRNMIGTVRDNIGPFTKLINDLLAAGISVIQKNVPKFIEMGFTIIDEFLRSAAKHVPNIVEHAVTLIEKFLGTLGKNAKRLADAGFKFIIEVLHGLADSIRQNDRKLLEAGIDVARALGEGLLEGLAMVRDWVMGKINELADLMPQWLQDRLGINSPAKVMIPIGRAIGQGVARGIADSTKDTLRAVLAMANAIIAEGNAQVLNAQKTARKVQYEAYRRDAFADMLEKKAAARRKKAEQFAKKNPNAAKAIRRQNAAAAKMERDAARRRNAAEQAQKKADAAVQRVEAVRAFEEADNVGKGDIRQDEAVVLADKANRMLAKANFEAAEAKKLQKTNKDAGRKMLEQARKDAAAAKKLAEAARKKNQEANAFYALEVDERLDQLKKDAAFDAADDYGKAALLNEWAAANELKAEALKNTVAALMAEAEAAAATDTAEALRLIQRAEEAAAEAQAAADEAQQQKDNAAQLLGGSGGDGGGIIEPSRSVLEDAASAVDRYTESLQQAEEMALAEQSVVQFVQNNHSPEALSLSEIYRQSKNLLSAAEIKMGANSVTTP